MMKNDRLSRRDALKLLGAVPSALSASGCRSSVKPYSHIITLSFDDGFEKSSIETARIYEKYGLSASLNVIATAHQKDFVLPNEYHRWPVGDFKLWNDLVARGHEIMPHGLKHEDLTKCGIAEAQDSINRCLDIFSRELTGFDPGGSIFNFPYNASSPELEEWLKSRVRAFRTSGSAVNPLPFRGQYRLTCVSSGPEAIDGKLDSILAEFLKGPPGWLIFNAHGLDDEGWGPVSSLFLDGLLGRLCRMPEVRVWTVSKALNLTASA